MWEVRSPAASLVFKKYSEAFLRGNPDYINRLELMLLRRPKSAREARGHVAVAWPADIVLDGQKFVGFVMPSIDVRER